MTASRIMILKNKNIRFFRMGFWILVCFNKVGKSLRRKKNELRSQIGLLAAKKGQTLNNDTPKSPNIRGVA
jgi:hypothetical protein